MSIKASHSVHIQCTSRKWSGDTPQYKFKVLFRPHIEPLFETERGGAKLLFYVNLRKRICNVNDIQRCYAFFLAIFSMFRPSIIFPRSSSVLLAQFTYASSVFSHGGASMFLIQWKFSLCRHFGAASMLLTEFWWALFTQFQFNLYSPITTSISIQWIRGYYRRNYCGEPISTL